MTRINLVPPSELTDQHLFAEFREIKMVPKALARSLNARGLEGVLKIIPRDFTLNKGHVCFFYDKGYYLVQRYHSIKAELYRRGVNFDINSRFDPDFIFHSNLSLRGDYTPTLDALKIIRNRLSEKIAMKPTWYKHEGRPLQ